MNLIIDVGNTRVKIAVFNNNELIHNEIITTENLLKRAFYLIEKFNCKHGIISSVGAIKKNEIIEINNKIKLIELNSTTKIPFKNNYATPKTLGVDRIALVSAAVLNYPNSNVLIIDAGTCVTYDFLTSEGVYLGGAISPGIKLRYKALHGFTEKLPLLDLNPDYSLIGDSTSSSIHSGVLTGILCEIDGVIDLYKEKNKHLTLVLTGGDINFLSNKLKNSIFANPNFLLQGLNKILTYNL